MPFILFCFQCGSVLYEDPSPLLQYGCYKSPTYFESILMKLGTNCPSCGHELHIPPLSIEIIAPKEERETVKTSRRENRKRSAFQNRKSRTRALVVE